MGTYMSDHVAIKRLQPYEITPLLARTNVRSPNDSGILHKAALFFENRSNSGDLAPITSSPMAEATEATFTVRLW